ncbi:MAG TPA: PadR family transcriptional regulator [Actinomycetota bacterium]|nr:PadR family transcriptional regulator [Actinomycetota bacterium]
MKQPGMLELAVLGLLKDRAMHGYELRKQLGAMLGPFWQVSWGSLYPALRRLAKSGAVEKVTDEVPKKRTTKRTLATTRTSKSTAARGTTFASGRRKTVYRITPQGDEMFSEMLEETAAAADAEHFTLKLAFFRYLPPESRVALLERRRAYLQDKLAQFKANLREYRERIDSYTLALHDHGMASTQSDIDWIDELLDRERSGSSTRIGRTRARRAVRTIES